ncbi:helix-turn-helix transcriptional regulator [Costertonia aggregata]|uniref:Helix-turn-helix transcriptional regulator n=1 Tax=Costertonia aggregata TaxID=343403 RepID=A0A7H9AUK1_9FLAO|nr:helix-turn-helix transcriptional regulator [Costertonia aggregata]QLG47077.1 helix-turn-helix transcriptional regulator [Costertonia aggregata]
MVNSQDFIKRLEKILHYYDLTASTFADKAGVQRSSISHLLTGRNKPSLEFVMKVVKSFPEVNLYWLLNGKGNFPAIASETSTLAKKAESINTTTPKSSKSIEKIIVFYTDGSFKAYEN